MGSRKARQSAARRDRRLAKASEFRREGTVNPKKVGHHNVDEKAFLDMPGVKPGEMIPLKRKDPRLVTYSTGSASTTLGDLIAEARRKSAE